MVDTIYKREKPWNSANIETTAEALEKGGLLYTVEQKPLYLENGKKANGIFANVRNDTGDVLGVVTTRYKVLQNKDAFDVLDAMQDFGARIETAGTLDGGKTAWVLTKLEPFQILDDFYENYLFFANGFDGKRSLKVGRTDVRIVCQNTLNLALRTASRLWSIRHMGNMEQKMLQASHILDLNNAYTKMLAQEAENYALAKLSKPQIEKFLDEMFPIGESNCLKERAEADRSMFLSIFDSADIGNFRNTKWGIIQAVSDMAYHAEPKRKSEKYAETKIKYAINGHPMLEKAKKLVEAL